MVQSWCTNIDLLHYNSLIRIHFQININPILFEYGILVMFLFKLKAVFNPPVCTVFQVDEFSGANKDTLVQKLEALRT